MISIKRLTESLNPEQRAAATHGAGPLLIVAGAGSGKTRVITTRIARLIATKEAKAEHILAVTFTNKAAREMRERVAQLTTPKAAEAVTISTFHSFCLQILRKDIEHLGYRRNFSIATEGDKRAMVRRVLDDMDGVKETFKPETILEAITSAKNSGGLESRAKDDVVRQKYDKYLPSFYEAYQSALRASNALDFDDFIGLTLSLWKEHPEALARARDQYRFVMVDEFQDTNRAQYELIHTLATPRNNLCVVGDDDQSIYAWRGAEPGIMRDLERDFAGLKVVKLEQNYRSTPNILNAANAVIARNTGRREKKLWSAAPAGRPIDLIITGDDEHEAKTALEWLKLIRSKSGAQFRDFAILYRSNTQSRPIEMALRQGEVPYQVVGGQDFYERAEIKDIVSYLKLLANPRDEASFLRIVNMPRRGIGDATLEKIHTKCLEHRMPFGKAMAAVLNDASVPKETERGLRALLNCLAHHRKRLRERSGTVSEIVTDLIDTIGYRAELLRTSKTTGQFETRWNNIEAILGAIVAYEAEDFAPTLTGFLDKAALVRDEPRSTTDDGKRNEVTLMTMHSAKGLEFPFVFIMGLEDGQLPHQKSVDYGDIEEERRLFYVGITRAQRHLTLFQALSRARGDKERMTQPSRFLTEIPPELINQRTAAAPEMVQERVDPNADIPKKRPKRKRTA